MSDPVFPCPFSSPLVILLKPWTGLLACLLAILIVLSLWPEQRLSHYTKGGQQWACLKGC